MKNMIKIFVSTVIMYSILFLTSWEWDWGMAWILSGMGILNAAVTIFFLDPGLLEERTKIKKDALKIRQNVFTP